MLTEAISFLRGAAASRGNAAAIYTFHDGWCYARNPAILAAYPTPELQGTFGLAAAQLEAALARFPTEPTISSNDDGSLILKSGRLRTSLVPVFVDPPEDIIVDIWQQVPTDFIEALRVVVPFLAKEGTWQRAVRFSGNTLTALNQRSAIEVTVPDLSAPEALVSDEFATYLIGLAESPIKMAFGQGAMFCQWPNSAWAKAQLLNFEWPASADKVMAMGGEEAPIAITDEWREAFKDAAALSDGQIQVCPEGLKGRLASMSVDIEFTTGVARTSKWAVQVLEPMFKVAERWNPDGEVTARFVGKNLRGIVAKLQG